MRRAKRKQPRDQRQSVIPRPPAIRTTSLVYTTRRRFLCISPSTGVGQTITYANILDSFLVATAATTGVQLFDMVKIRRVQMWAPSTSAAVPTTVQVCFDGKTAGSVGDALQHTATSIGMTEPAYLDARPSKRSQASQFQGSSSNTAMILVMPVNTILDVELTYVNALDNATPTAVTSALVGATAGDLYFRGIDGGAVAGSKWTPQGSIAVM